MKEICNLFATTSLLVGTTTTAGDYFCVITENNAAVVYQDWQVEQKGFH